jgi:DNA-binding FadR family transcriptional regulator
MPALTRLNRRTEKVAEHVAREIVHDCADLPAGSVLPSESAMVDKYQVSRGSLREALRILEVQGLLLLKPGPRGGPIFTRSQPEKLAQMLSLHFHIGKARYRDLVDARLALEPMLAGLAAARSDREAVRGLDVFVAIPTPEQLEDEEYVLTAASFHSAIGQLCGNPVLSILTDSMLHLVIGQRRQDAMFDDVERHTILHDHSNIAKAIIDGNAKRAEKLMREHMVEWAERSYERYAGLIDAVVDWH